MEKGFFGSLFDLSFSSLITTKVIKVIYAITMVAIGVIAVVFVLGAFSQSAGAGIATLVILAPVLSVLWLIYTRVVLEVIIVLFRIMETNVELVQLQRATVAPQAPPEAPPHI